MMKYWKKVWLISFAVQIFLNFVLMVFEIYRTIYLYYPIMVIFDYIYFSLHEITGIPVIPMIYTFIGLLLGSVTYSSIIAYILNLVNREKSKSPTIDKDHPIESNLPKGIQEVLFPGETVLFSVLQSRLKNVAFPACIALTETRLLAYAPGLLKTGVEQWLYGDIQNVIGRTGVLFGSVEIIPRFGDKIKFDNFTNEDAKELSRKTMERISKSINIQTQQSQMLPSQPVIDQPIRNLEDPITVAKLRFAKGEITKEQLQEILNILND